MRLETSAYTEELFAPLTLSKKTRNVPFLDTKSHAKTKAWFPPISSTKGEKSVLNVWLFLENSVSQLTAIITTSALRRYLLRVYAWRRSRQPAERVDRPLATTPHSFRVDRQTALNFDN